MIFYCLFFYFGIQTLINFRFFNVKFHFFIMLEQLFPHSQNVISLKQFFRHFFLFVLVSRSAPGELCSPAYIFFNCNSDLDRQHFYLFSTSSSTNRSKNMVTGGFLLLSSSKIHQKNYKFITLSKSNTAKNLDKLSLKK